MQVRLLLDAGVAVDGPECPLAGKAKAPRASSMTGAEAAFAANRPPPPPLWLAAQGGHADVVEALLAAIDGRRPCDGYIVVVKR